MGVCTTIDLRHAGFPQGLSMRGHNENAPAQKGEKKMLLSDNGTAASGMTLLGRAEARC
jgi:hypothetical protein